MMAPLSSPNHLEDKALPLSLLEETSLAGSSLLFTYYFSDSLFLYEPLNGKFLMYKNMSGIIPVSLYRRSNFCDDEEEVK